MADSYYISPWAFLDLNEMVRNWSQDYSGANVRALSNANAIQQLAAAISNLCGGQPRVMFAQSRGGAGAYNAAADADPLWQWKLDDDWDNGRVRLYRVLAMPRVNAPGGAGGDAYAHVEGSATDKTPTALTGTAVATSPVYPRDLIEAEIRFARGAKGGAETTDGITALDGYTIHDLVVQDDLLQWLDGAIHVDVSGSGLPSHGDPIVAGIVEELRSALHAARTLNQPAVISWAANACESDAQPASTGVTGIKVASDTYVNILDSSVTSRTATSPGHTCPAWRAGRGPHTTEAGRKVRLQCRVLARNTHVANNAAVKLIGPTHVASNEREIIVPANLAPTWYGGASDLIYLDSATADDDATVARNKVDIHAKCATGTDYLWIYGFCAWLEWG